MTKPTSLIARVDGTGIPLLLARLGVGAMFAYTGVMKLMNPLEFLKLTRDYQILPVNPPYWLNLTAIAVPWLEVVCAAALILGVARRGAALILNGMLLFFTPMLAWRAWTLLQAGDFATYCAVKFDCGCGTGEQFICRKLVENVVLQVGALIALFSASHRFCLASLWRRRPGPLAAASAPAAVAAAPGTRLAP